MRARHAGWFRFLPGLLAAVLPAAATGQSFTKITDAANPIVTLGGGPGGSFIGSSWVDTDGDGDLDLFIVRNGLFRNDGAGAFTHLPGAIASQGLATGNTWADVDNDGDPDCYVAGGTPSGSALYLNLGGNAFQKVVSGAIADTAAHFGWAAAFGDYDRDGRVDLVLAAPFGFNGVTGPNRLFHNEGGGGFTRVDTSTVATGLAFYTVPSWSDFDDDGDPDLWIGSGSGGGALGEDFLYRNRLEVAPGWLERYLDAPLGTDLHDGQVYNWVDYDNDGDLDVYLTNFGGNANNLYANLGGGMFVKRTFAEVGPIVSDVSPSLASVWEDFDNDGDLDCYVTNAQTFAARFYRNDGGVFAALAIPPLTGAGPHWGATAGDYDGDGLVDLYVNGNGTTHGLFRNTTVTANHWLDVRLEGTVSNRSAIGARVRVRSVTGGSPRWQMREVSSQNSFDGMNRFDPHFGLAEATVAESVVVEWPSGLRSVRVAVGADQRITITEMGGTTAVQVSLVETTALAGRVRVVWALADAANRVIGAERRSLPGPWTPIDVPARDGLGRITLEDPEVEPGRRYGYRLVIEDEGAVHRAGETEVDVPAAPELALRLLGPNPSAGAIEVEFVIPVAGAVEIEVFDVRGRRVDSWHDKAAPAGRHAIALGTTRAHAPGVYLVRLRNAGLERTMRVIRQK